MTLFKVFTSSLTSIKKIAAFRLMPMGKTMQYIFLFIFLFTLLAFLEFTTQIGTSAGQLDGVVDYFEEIDWLLYPFAFLLLFVIQTLLFFTQISLVAAVAWLAAPIMKRRADYRFLWRSTLFANTWSFLLLLISYLVFEDSPVVHGISYALTLVIVLLALRYYPKLPKKA
ncbi:DUF1189 family protein [Chryseomicrobium sp. FSL W7-1435]|uniref:DUF1189 family protein n=1 Tax=Chryseomicrobium sp. FSL W7-1435 TaxID=2921704 RepID=UPI00315AB636